MSGQHLQRYIQRQMAQWQLGARFCERKGERTDIMNMHRLAGQTLSRAHIGIPLCLVLLVLLAPLASRAQTHNEMQGSNAVIDFNPAELRPMPSPDAIA